jgi:anti-sigma28 factor (negative regulator of flagellin synthesis)
MSRLFHARRNMQKLLKQRLDHVPTSTDDPGSSKKGKAKQTRSKGDETSNKAASGSVTQEAAS